MEPLANWLTSDWALASSRTMPSEFCERQEACWPAGLRKQLSLILIPRLRAAISACDLRSAGSSLRADFDIGQIGFEAHPFPTGGLQILGGTHEGAGLVADRLAQGVEVAAGLRGEEEQGLLRLSGDVDEYTLVAGLAGPGFHAREPLGGGGLVDPRRKATTSTKCAA